MKTCLIITGGDFAMLPKDVTYDFVIACDHGYDHAVRMGIKPDLLLGDFDSLMSKPEESGIPVLTFPVRKDDSDTMIAIRHALSNGFTHLILCCALGGRLDHLYANLQALGYVACNHATAELYGEGEYIRTFTGGSLDLPKREGWSFSLFSFSDLCEDICISGAVYSAEHITLKNTFPLGLSNSWKEEMVSLSMKKGILLIMESALPNIRSHGG